MSQLKFIIINENPLKMNYDTLSENGIEKVLGMAPSVVQIIDFQIRQKGDANFFMYISLMTQCIT